VELMTTWRAKQSLEGWNMETPIVIDATTSARPCTPIPRRADGGASLVEVLVSVVLLGIVGVGVLSAFAGTIRASTTNRELGLEQSWLASAADLLESDAVPVPPCEVGAVAAYQSALDALPATDRPWPAGAVRVTAVERWIAADARFDPVRCDRSAQLHRVTLSASASVGGATTVLQTLKVGG
jgi:type II secretory pathway pseudopilin PulG